MDEAKETSLENTSEEEKVFCVKCGAEILPGNAFCPKCGHKVGEKLVSDAPASQTASAKAVNKKLIGIIAWAVLAVAASAALPIIIWETFSCRDILEARSTRSASMPARTANCRAVFCVVTVLTEDAAAEVRVCAAVVLAGVVFAGTVGTVVCAGTVCF